MNSVIKNLRTYLAEYLHFTDQRITVPLSLWIMATYVFETFDAFAYLVITARVKRAGKTRLSELIGFTCNMPFPVAAASAPSLLRAIENDKPTIIWDEAETLYNESANTLRALLNVGYRKGQTIPRTDGDGVKQWPTYCPKTFVLIGDVYDTLRDRSIIVEMQRGKPIKSFRYDIAKSEGSEIREQLRMMLIENADKIESAYFTEDVSFLSDREEEIWRPIFALCRVFCPEDYETLQVIAADMSADKKNPERYKEDKAQDAINEAMEQGLILLRDVNIVAITYAQKNKNKAIPSVDLLQMVKAIPTAPWRKYHSPSELKGRGAGGGGRTTVVDGSGLTIVQMCYLLERFGVEPKPQRVGKKVFRGYSIDAIITAAQKWGGK